MPVFCGLDADRKLLYNNVRLSGGIPLKHHKKLYAGAIIQVEKWLKAPGAQKQSNQGLTNGS